MRRSPFAFLPCLLLCLVAATAGCGGSESDDPDTTSDPSGFLRVEAVRQDNSRAIRVSWPDRGLLYPSKQSVVEYRIYRSKKFAQYAIEINDEQLVGIVPAGVESFVDTKDARTLTVREITPDSPFQPGVFTERTLETKSVTAPGLQPDDSPYYRVVVLAQYDRDVPIFGKYGFYWLGGYGDPYRPTGG